LAASPQEQHAARFAANADDRVSFEYLEEHLYMQAEWAALADLYRRRQGAPGLAGQPRQRAELALRLAQVCEERLGDADGAIRAYTEAVQLEPKLRRALRQLRRLYEQRGSWEAVLQIGEQEASLADSAEERARAFVVMADVWQRHLGDLDQAEQLYARARAEGWSDPRASAPAPAAPKPAPAAAVAADPALVAEAPDFSIDDEFEFYPDLEVDDDQPDVELDAPAPIADDLPETALTMPDLVAKPPTGEQRSGRVLGVLERKLAEREARGVGLDAESLHLRLRIAELRAGSIGDPVAAIAVLEPALASAAALLEVAPTLAGLYEQLGRTEPLISLAERTAAASQPRDQRVFWLRRAADASRAAGDPLRAIACYQQLLGELPLDRGARSALGDLYRSRGDAQPLVALLRDELANASPERELELQLELASLHAESLGDPSGAVPHLRRCLELEPGRSDLLEWAISASALRGDPLGPLDLVEHACERATSDGVRAALLARRGVLLADTLRWNEEAAASWQAALALDPQQALARERLAA
jgi:tetratricopeptide (TPR) repeat protein